DANISRVWHAFFEETEPKNETYPRSSIVRFKFPARGKLPPVAVTWWAGRLMGDLDGGILLIGDEGAIMAGCYGESPRIVPESLMKKYKRPKKTIPRIEGGKDGHEE